MTAITGERRTVGELGAYVARPTGSEPTGGMLLLPMITGIGAQLRAYADAIAATGVLALSWDPWHGHSIEDRGREELFELMGQLTDSGVREEQEQLLDHMFGELGLERVGVIGWCMGGRFALLLAARDHRLANCVAYHPTIPAEPAPNHTEDPVALAAEITAPVSVVYPGADDLVPRSVFTALRDTLESRPDAATNVSLYPHAEHGFMDAARRDKDNNREPTRQSWAQTLAFIGTTAGEQATQPV